MPPQPNLQSKPEASPQDELKRIRTYESDVQEIMQRGQVSKATIAIAANEKQVEREEEQEATPPPTPATPTKVFNMSNSIPLALTHWNVRLILLLSVAVLAVISIGVGAFFYIRSPKAPVVQEPKTTVPKTNTIALQGGEKRAGAITAIQREMKNISVPQNQLQTFSFTLGGVPITTPSLFETVEASAPTPLVRALGTTPTLGLHGFQGGQPFLLFTVLSYDHAFAGMLAWEETMLEDFGPLFDVLPRTILENVGSTTSKALGNRIAFKDVIIRNKDARAAFDPEGTIIFLYSFIDKQTLVLTTKEETLRVLQSKAGGGRVK